MTRRPRRLDPYRLYLGLELAMGLLLGVAQATVIVYWVSGGHLDPLRLLLLGTALEGAYFVLQLPTGALADLVSRRASVIAGIAVLAISYVGESLSPAFVNLLAAQVGVALGAALIYGAEEAWVAGELPDAETTHLFVRGTQLGLIGTVVGSIASGLLIFAGRNVPLLSGGLGMAVLAGVLALVMPERHFHRRGEVVSTLVSTSGSALIGQARGAGRAARAVPGLVLLFAVTVLFGMWSESFDRLWGDYFLTDIHFPAGIRPGVWFGLVAGVVALLAVGATELAKRSAARSGGGRLSATLAGLLALTCAAVVGMVLARQFALALAAYLVVAAVRPASAPLINGWMVTRIDPCVRATALSARDMCDSAGQIAGGPVFGLIGTITSIRIALLAGAAVLVPAVGLLASPGQRVTLPNRASQLPESTAEEADDVSDG